jgi:hypothetical protein
MTAFTSGRAHGLSTDDPDMDELLAKCIELLRVKGHDYTVGSPDRLNNFKMAGEFFDLPPEKVLGVYVYKHVTAIWSWIKSGGQSESEPIFLRLADAINYFLLLGKMVAEKKRESDLRQAMAQGELDFQVVTRR